MTLSSFLSGTFAFLSGTMPSFAEKVRGKPVLSFFDRCLRSIGQICIMNNPLTGLLILLVIIIAEPLHGLAMLIGVLTANAIADISCLDRGAAAGGLFGFNGALVGAGLFVFLDVSQYGLILAYTALVSAISVPVMASLMAWLGSSSQSTISPLTLPFNFVTLTCLMGLQLVRHNALPEDASVEAEPMAGEVNTALRDAPGAEELDVTVLLVIEILLRGMSQLFLVENAIVGLVVLIAITLCSPISGLASILGSAAGSLCAAAIGADGHSIYLGLFGYNGFVTAIAIAGVFLRFTRSSLILAVLAAGITTLCAVGMQSAFDFVGMPILTLPFCVVTLAFILFSKMSHRFEVLPLTEVTVPEDHLRRASN